MRRFGRPRISSAKRTRRANDRTDMCGKRRDLDPRMLAELQTTGALANPGSAPTRENPMIPIKMLGPAVLAALLVMAFAGASSAMAEPTTLCSADENPCSEKSVVLHVHETSVGKALLLT